MWSLVSSWLHRVLSSLGLVNKRGRLVLLGLDNAGKSTLLLRLQHQRLTMVAPTLYPTNGEFRLGGVTFSSIDVGGHESARQLWQQYCMDMDVVAFVVDAADRHRLDEVKTELHGVLEFLPPQTPVAILANKTDMPVALTRPELEGALGLVGLTTGKSAEAAQGMRPCEIFPCSVLKNEGYQEAFQWLGRFLK